MAKKIGGGSEKEQNQCSVDWLFANLFALLIELLMKQTDLFFYGDVLFESGCVKLFTRRAGGRAAGIVNVMRGADTRSERDYWTKINCKQCE